MIKYSAVFLAWSYGLAYIMPPLWAGFIGFWIALSLIITVHDDTWLKLLQPKVIWVQPPEHQAPSSLAKEFESDQSLLDYRSSNYHRPRQDRTVCQSAGALLLDKHILEPDLDYFDSHPPHRSSNRDKR